MAINNSTVTGCHMSLNTLDDASETTVNYSNFGNDAITTVELHA